MDMLLDLQRAGKAVVVTFAQSGGMPMSGLLREPPSLRRFFEICRSADAAVATSFESEEVLRGAGAHVIEFIPVPCPLDEPRWDFSVPVDQRRGIFVGSRDFATYYDNHAAALLSLRELAAEASEPVTVVLSARFNDRLLIRQIRRHWPAGLLKVIGRPPPAEQLMRRMATHRLVFQLEWGGGVGQVAAEALLCRIPCVGGHGTTERLAFPDLCGFGRSTDELVGLATRLVKDREAADAVVDRARALAVTHLSPAEARSRMASLVNRAAAQRG
jgi:hypothetical protein